MNLKFAWQLRQIFSINFSFTIFTERYPNQLCVSLVLPPQNSVIIIFIFAFTKAVSTSVFQYT